VPFDPAATARTTLFGPPLLRVEKSAVDASALAASDRSVQHHQGQPPSDQPHVCLQALTKTLEGVWQGVCLLLPGGAGYSGYILRWPIKWLARAASLSGGGPPAATRASSTELRCRRTSVVVAANRAGPAVKLQGFCRLTMCCSSSSSSKHQLNLTEDELTPPSRCNCGHLNAVTSITPPEAAPAMKQDLLDGSEHQLLACCVKVQSPLRET